MTELLLITHAPTGSALVDNAQHILGENLPDGISVFDIQAETVPDTALASLRQQSKNRALLILTDLYGSTPANIAVKLASEQPTLRIVVSGVNLAMLLRAIRYQHLPPAELAEKVQAGGHRAILVIDHNSAPAE